MKDFLKINKTSRKWHLPFIAGLCVGLPLFVGWYLDQLEGGKIAALAGLSILYIQSNQLNERMMLLMTCCFGIIVCYMVGLFCSLNILLAPIALGLLSFGVHYSIRHLSLERPPGNFFFIMLAATAICMPFELQSIPQKIGYLTLGTVSTCAIGLIYSIIIIPRSTPNEKKIVHKLHHTNLFESMIFGTFIGLSLAIAVLLNFENPYWVPVSCLAVMQGSNTSHIWVRALQRVVGTLLGLGITWFIVSQNPSPLFMVLGIIALQIIVEYLIVRNYAITVIFITILTIFLAESGKDLTQNTNTVFMARLLDIIVGSCMGVIGGWMLYHNRLNRYTSKKIRQSKQLLSNLKRRS